MIDDEILFGIKILNQNEVGHQAHHMKNAAPSEAEEFIEFLLIATVKRYVF